MADGNARPEFGKDGGKGGTLALQPTRVIAPGEPVALLQVEKAALVDALDRARDEARKAERSRADAALRAVKAAHSADMDRARAVELEERTRIIAAIEDKARHRVRGARTFGILVGGVAMLAVSVPVTWWAATVQTTQGVDIGIEAMGKSRIIENTISRGRDEPGGVNDDVVGP